MIQSTIPMAPNILVVDDDPTLQRVVSRFLEVEGFSPISATNGLEALAFLRDGGRRVDVILLDLRMPVMDGWTFRQHQRADPALAAIPVVVLAGADTDRVPELAAAAAFQKPAHLAEVVAAIRALAPPRAESTH